VGEELEMEEKRERAILFVDRRVVTGEGDGREKEKMWFKAE
jgi:hypothetical protein